MYVMCVVPRSAFVERYIDCTNMQKFAKAPQQQQQQQQNGHIISFLIIHLLPAFQVAIQVQTLNRLHVDRSVGRK